jgi:hypothetical protein
MLMTIAASTVARDPLPISTPARSAEPTLLTDPYLQRPTERSVQVAWVTEFEGRRHLLLYGPGVDRLKARDIDRIAEGRPGLFGRRIGLRVAVADTILLSRMREDAESRLADGPPEGMQEGPVHRPLWRHAAEATGLRPGRRVPYRVLSIDDQGRRVLGDVFTLAPKPARRQDMKILLTSDHQTLPMTPANLQKVEETVGTVDAVFFAGDLVNHPDRASQWFDDARGGAFFPALQGRAARIIKAEDGSETRYRGGRLIQYAPLYPVIGNHEVMGRAAPGRTLAAEFNAAVPRDVAAGNYEKRAEKINPNGDPAVRARWILDNSFNVESYRQLFTLPNDSPGGENYWAETLGDVRVIGLYVTQVWRTPNVPTDRPGRYLEPESVLDDELEQGWGQHLLKRIDAGSEQLAWLERELQSPDFKRAKYRVVLMHHPIHSLGANTTPPFTNPLRIEERDADGTLTGVRYDYPRSEDHLARDLKPLLQRSGVHLVVNGHSHLWNRFEDRGVHYLETSNVGNTFGAYHEATGLSRTVPPAPWNPENATAQGDPNGLEPIAPNIRPQTGEDGETLPFIASDRITVFSILDTRDGSVTSYAFDTGKPDSDALAFDSFVIGP